jgi:hypothetical protein
MSRNTFSSDDAGPSVATILVSLIFTLLVMVVYVELMRKNAPFFAENQVKLYANY